MKKKYDLRLFGNNTVLNSWKVLDGGEQGANEDIFQANQANFSSEVYVVSSAFHRGSTNNRVLDDPTEEGELAVGKIKERPLRASHG